jgi:hypothetical protein
MNEPSILGKPCGDCGAPSRERCILSPCSCGCHIRPWQVVHAPGRFQKHGDVLARVAAEVPA